MSKITVDKIGDWEFEVVVEDKDGTESTHQVALEEEFAKECGGDPQDLVKKSFEFLLEREAKESILPTFTIPDTIVRYFPEFESEMEGS